MFARFSLIYGVLFFSGSGSQLVCCSSYNIFGHGEPAGNEKDLSEKKVNLLSSNVLTFFPQNISF